MITTAEPCGCVRTEKPGHTHTKLCLDHRAAAFSGASTYDVRALLNITPPPPPPRDNSDLI